MDTTYQKGSIPYTALFILDQEGLFKIFPPKHPHVFGHHVTLEFNPANFDNIHVGKKSILKIIAWIYDDKGDALLVETDRSKKNHPHITLSCAEGIRRSYSDEMIEQAFKNNTVEFLDSPTEIEVIEGYFDGENDITN